MPNSNSEVYSVLPGVTLPYGKGAVYQEQLGFWSFDSKIGENDGHRTLERHFLLRAKAWKDEFSDTYNWKRLIGNPSEIVKPNLSADHFFRERVVVGQNDPSSFERDTYVKGFPVYTKWGKILNEHPVETTPSNNLPNPLPLVGKDPVDVDKLKAKSQPGSSETISEFEFVSLAAREVSAHFQMEIDQTIASGKPFTSDSSNVGKKAMSCLRSFLLLWGHTPGGSEVALAASIQFQTVLLMRSREMMKDELAQLAPNYEIEFTTNPINAKQNHFPKNLGEGGAQVSEEFKRKQNEALRYLGLPTAPEVSIDELQARLVKLGQDDPNVVKFLDTYPMSSARKEILKNLLVSQTRLEQEAVDKNIQIAGINSDLASGSGTAEKYAQAVEALNKFNQWDESMELMPEDAPKSSPSTIAALTAAKTVLTKGRVSDQELKDEIEGAVTPALSKNNTSGGTAAKAGEAATGALKKANDYFKKTKEAKEALHITVSSLKVAQRMAKDEKLSMDSLKALLTPHVVRENLDSMVDRILDAKTFATSELRESLNSIDPQQKAEAELKIIKSVVLRSALILKLKQAGVNNNDTIGRFTLEVISQFVSSGKLDQSSIQKLMDQELGAEKNRVTSAQLNEAGQIALLVSEGMKAHSDAFSNKIAAEFEEAKIPSVVAKKIAKKYEDEAKGGEVKNDQLIAIIKNQIKSTNQVIAAICKENVDDFGFSNIETAFNDDKEGKASFKAATLEIAKNYKEQGIITKEQITQILTHHLHKEPIYDWLPLGNEQSSFQQMADVFLARITAGKDADIGTDIPLQVTNEPRINIPRENQLNNLVQKTHLAYQNISIDSAKAAAAAVAKSAGDDGELIGNEVEQQFAGKTRSEVAAAAADKLTSGAGFATRMSLAAVLSLDNGYHDEPIEQAYIDSQSALKKATYTAIITAVNTYACNEGTDLLGPRFANTLVTQYMIDAPLDLSNMLDLKENAKEYLEQIFFKSNEPESLGIGPDNYNVNLKELIQNKLFAHCVKLGKIDNAAALKIVNEAIDEYNKTHQPQVAPSTGCNFEHLDPSEKAPIPLKIEQQLTSIKMKFQVEAQKAVILTAGLQALENAEKKYGKDPSPVSNFREVALAVVPAAMAGEKSLSQEQAIQLSGQITDLYVKNKGKVDDLNVAQIKALVRAINLTLTDAEGEQTAKYVLAAVKSSAKLPEKDKIGAVTAGTSVSASTFPLFSAKNEAAAGALTTLITQARGGSSQDISRAATYTQNLSKMRLSKTPFASVAAGALHVYHDVKAHAGDMALVVKNQLLHAYSQEKAERIKIALSNVLETTDLKSETALIGAYISASGVELDMSNSEITAAARAAKRSMGHDKDLFAEIFQASLTFEGASDCQRVIDNLNDRTNYQIPLSNDIRAIRVGREAIDPAAGFATQGLKADAQFLFQKVRKEYLRNLPEPGLREKAKTQYCMQVATATAARAAADFAIGKMQSSNDPLEKMEAAKLARAYSRRAIQYTEGVKHLVEKNMPQGSLAGPDFQLIKLDKPKINALTNAAWMGQLVHTGVKAFEDSKQAESHKKAAEAVVAIAKASGVIDEAELAKIKHTSEKIIKQSNPEEAGVAVASHFKDAPPEVAHAYSAVVTDIMTDHQYDKVADSVKAASIGEKGALSSPMDQEAELQKVENDKRLEAQKALNEANEALKNEQLKKIPQDKTGILKAAKSELGDASKLDVNKITLVLPSYGSNPKDKEAKPLRDLYSHIYKKLMKLGVHVNAATLRAAVDAINETLPEHRKLEVEDNADSVSVNLKGLSHNQIQALLNKWVEVCENSQTDKNSAVKAEAEELAEATNSYKPTK